MFEIGNVEQKIAEDFEFQFLGGATHPVTLYPASGDSMSIDPDNIKISMAERVHPMDPDMKLPAEDILIFTRNLLWVRHRQRVEVPPTPEQKREWQELVESMAGQS
jgi:hypothetical protein